MMEKQCLSSRLKTKGDNTDTDNHGKQYLSSRLKTKGDNTDTDNDGKTMSVF